MSTFENKYLKGGQAKKEISIVVLGQQGIRKLNKTYRAKDKPTNVLAFESKDPASLGEVFLCPQIIEKEAKQRGLAGKTYFQYILIHGLLHLVGMDHQTPKDRSKMEKAEDNLLNTI